MNGIRGWMGNSKANQRKMGAEVGRQGEKEERRKGEGQAERQVRRATLIR